MCSHGWLLQARSCFCGGTLTDSEMSKFYPSKFSDGISSTGSLWCCTSVRLLTDMHPSMFSPSKILHLVHVVFYFAIAYVFTPYSYYIIQHRLWWHIRIWTLYVTMTVKTDTICTSISMTLKALNAAYVWNMYIQM